MIDGSASDEIDLSTKFGPGAAWHARGAGRVSIGALAGRFSCSPYAVNIGFATGQGAHGRNHIHIGDHAGSPTMDSHLLDAPRLDPETRRLVTHTPAGVDLEMDTFYRLVFRNGFGAVPRGLVGTSVPAIIVSTDERYTTWALDARPEDAGHAYQVGLCYSNFDDDIQIGNGWADGSGQVGLGFDRTVEILPQLSGKVSLGRSPEEARTRGTRGVMKWRGVTAQFLGAYGDGDEPSRLTLGLGQVKRWEWRCEPVTGNLFLTAYNGDGRELSTPLWIDNETGIFTLHLPVYQNSWWARRGGLKTGAAYRTRNGSIRVVPPPTRLQTLFVTIARRLRIWPIQR